MLAARGDVSRMNPSPMLLVSVNFFKKIWKECSNLSTVPTIPTGTCLARLFVEAEDNKKSALAIFLASIIYYTWRARNCFMHGEPYLQPSAIAIKALHDANIGNWNVHCNQQASWTSPPVGWLKVNFDGSVYTNFKAGLGCVVRDHHGGILAAKGVKTFSRSVSMTEFRSASMSLELARRFFGEAVGIIVEGDSMETCNRLNRILAGAALGISEIALAKICLEAPRIVISLVDREANKAADLVAKNAAEYDFDWERGMPQSQELLFIIQSDYDL
ncbi:hypothetical protein KSP39_PZI010662 [Platanthera zijinensis]|uniref:RNase H type-1 domain-containing protein n=1 Tax=Platanthera zijinensis TaxID=2320716 RepID=A0AAP0BHZ6_9ASPA